MDDTTPQPQAPLQRLLVKLAASRFFTFSLLIHVLLVIVLGSVALYKSVQETPDIIGDPGGLVGDSGGDDGPPAPPEAQPETEYVPPTPTMPTSVDLSNAIISTATADFAMAATPVVPTTVTTPSVTPVTPTVGRGGGNKGLPGAMASRGGAGRDAARRAGGGTDPAEKAVMNGLRWLQKNQNDDGSWGEKFKGAMTGLAMLSFLGHGEDVTSPEFGGTVRKGMEFQIALGEKNQGNLNVTTSENPTPYAHGIATYALAEAYVMTKEERIIPVLTQAVERIVKGQNSEGGWDYGYKTTGGRSDLSVMGWQIQALKAAHLTELALPGVDAALNKSMLRVKKFQANKGGFGYTKPENKYSLTGVGVLALQFWKPDSNAIRQGIDFILAGPEVDYKGKDADLYAWYYNTQACFQKQGSAWEKWNRVWQPQIVGAQSPDGSWPPHGGKEHGGMNAVTKDGDVYRTTLSILMLEVFYRYSLASRT